MEYLWEACVKHNLEPFNHRILGRTCSVCVVGIIYVHWLSDWWWTIFLHPFSIWQRYKKAICYLKIRVIQKQQKNMKKLTRGWVLSAKL